MKRAAIFIAAMSALLGLLTGSIAAQSTPSGLSGMLGVVYFDHTGNPALSMRQFTLHTFDGQDVPVEIPDDVLAAAGGIFAIQHQPIEILTDGTAARDGKVRASAIRLAIPPRWYTADPSGALNWRILLCTVSNNSSEPVTQSRVQTVFGGATNGMSHYWQNTSHGATTVVPTVLDWQPLPRSFSQYQQYDFNSRLDVTFADCVNTHSQSLTGAYNITVIFNVDMFNGYALGGYGYNGPSLVRQTWISVWSADTFHSSLLAHEMGHSYGMPHSNNNDGDNNPYDNPWDLMSDGYAGDSDATYGYYPPPSNSYYYRKIGFISGGNDFSLTSGTNASITLDRWGVSSTSNYYLATIPVPGKNYFYTVEARKASMGGYESNLIGDGVLVYKVDNTRNEPAWMVLGEGAGAALTSGEFYQNADGVSVYVEGTTLDGYNVRIAQGTSLFNVSGISPVGTVTSPNVTFEWTKVDPATTYSIALMSVDGAQTLNFNAGSTCIATCTFTFNPATYGWSWREGVKYKWKVTAKNGGAKYAKSASAKFTFDALPGSITTTSPTSGEVDPDGIVTFIWADDSRFTDFRVVATKPTGQVVTSAWVTRASACNVQCVFSYDFGAKKKLYTWWVEGRADGIAGKIKSSKKTVKVKPA